MNQFGGNWTELKMKIVVEYAKAYLTIMNKQPSLRTIYFDGFAGSGTIAAKNDEDSKKGTALRILDIKKPKPFDTYYFVESNPHFKDALEKEIKENYVDRQAFVVQDDCNTKLVAMGGYLRNNKLHRALAFIDPYGMDVNWSSIEALRGLGIDLWILVPTGIGPNRLLKKDWNISETWYSKLEKFLGLSRSEIDKEFYSRKIVNTLFGEEEKVNKEVDAIQKIGTLYSKRLNEVFKYVSKPFVMKNSMNSIMYHFMMATNNYAGCKIANDTIKPRYEDHG